MDAPPNKKIRQSTESPFTSRASESPHQVPNLLLLDESSANDINSPQAAFSVDRDPLSSLHEGNTHKNGSTKSVSKKKKVPKDSMVKKKFVLNDTVRDMVVNVFKYVCKIKYEEDKREALEFETVKVRKTACVLKTAEILGISRTTVYRVLKEHGEEEIIIS